MSVLRDLTKRRERQIHDPTAAERIASGEPTVADLGGRTAASGRRQARNAGEFQPRIPSAPAAQWEAWPIASGVPFRRFFKRSLDFNPTTGRIAVVAEVTTPGFRLWYSDNGGKTWTDGGLAAPTDNEVYGSFVYGGGSAFHFLRYHATGLDTIYRVTWDGAWQAEVALVTSTFLSNVQAARTRDGTARGFAYIEPISGGSQVLLKHAVITNAGTLGTVTTVDDSTTSDIGASSELALLYEGSNPKVVRRPLLNFANDPVGSESGTGSRYPNLGTREDFAIALTEPDALLIIGNEAGNYEDVWQAAFAANGDVHALKSPFDTTTLRYRRRKNGVWASTDIDFETLRKPLADSQGIFWMHSMAIYAGTYAMGVVAALPQAGGNPTLYFLRRRIP
jgi:hypothetical protein